MAFPPFTPGASRRAIFVAGLLKNRCAVHDETFDAIYPEVIRRASSMHWTPVAVCARIVRLLALEPEQELVDIGAGAGKFCIVAAAMSGARVRGVEREPELARVAREAARRLGVTVEIEDGSFDPHDPRGFDAAYLFNPFAEALLLPGATELSTERRAARTTEDVAAAKVLLNEARVGARVVTYCGFGGEMPNTYRRKAHEWWDGGLLELWEKTEAAAITRLDARASRSQVGGATG